MSTLPDGRRALSASADKTLKLWDLETGNPLAAFTADSDLFAVAIAANDRFVAGSHGSVTLPNRARNKSPGTFGSRCGDDFTPRLQGRCAEGSVRALSRY